MKNYMYIKLKGHIGHNIACVSYGDAENPVDICIECEDCCEVLISAEDFTKMVVIESKSYEYGGKHFIPHSKLEENCDISDLKLSSDEELGFFDDYEYNSKRGRFNYSHKEFYEAMENSEMDIFTCLENGKLYIPGNRELFIYEGIRKKTSTK